MDDKNINKVINPHTKRYDELKEKILQLENDINKIKKDKNIFDALVKLNECNALINKEFKKVYKQTFKPKRTEYIHNFWDYINDPPNENEKEYYDFWNNFFNLYPRSDDLQFRKIYSMICHERANNGAHCDINNLTKDEFDNAMELVFSDYKDNKKLYCDYRDWSFSFPSI